MGDFMKILFFAGSARKGSWNKKLARQACKIAEELGVEVTFIDLQDFPMPLYHADLEREKGMPEGARRLKELFITHDGFFIAAPEYNSSLTPLLKNSLDWISRQHEEGEPPLVAFKDKAVAISSASPGAYGGMRALVPLRLMLNNIGTFVVPEQLAVAHADEAFDNADLLIKEQHRNILKKIIKQLIQVVRGLEGEEVG